MSSKGLNCCNFNKIRSIKMRGFNYICYALCQVKLCFGNRVYLRHNFTMRGALAQKVK